MKHNLKYICSLLLLSGFSYGTLAQNAPGRTAKTIVADAMAQLPASNEATYNKLMNELLDVNDDAIVQIVTMMNAPGKGDNTSMEFALNGMSRFAMMDASREPLRQKLEKAFIASLSKVQNEEVKFFVLTQLVLIGKDHSVDAVRPYINSNRLSDVSCRVLAAVNTPKAQKAIELSIPAATGEALINLIQAAGEMGLTKSEKDILEKLKSASDGKLKQVSVKALGALGTGESLPLLFNLAKSENFLYNPQYMSSEAYFNLAKRLAVRKNEADNKVIEKQLAEIFKSCKNENQVHASAAALNILTSIKYENALPEITKAIDSKSKVLRQAAILNAVDGISAASIDARMAKKLKGANPESQIDYMDYFAMTKSKAGEENIIKLLGSKNESVKLKAIRTLGRLGDENSLVALSGVLTSTDTKVISAAEQALLAFKGEISEKLMSGYDSYSPAGKVLAISMAGRRADTKAAVKIFSLLSEGDNAISAAAYEALKGVATQSQLPQLYDMLNKEVDAVKVQNIQAAILAVLAPMDVKTKEQLLLGQMGKAPANKKNAYFSLLAKCGASSPELLTSYFQLLATGSLDDAKIGAECLNSRNDNMEVISRSISAMKQNSKLTSQLIPVVMGHIEKGGLNAENRLIYLRDIFALSSTDEQKMQIISAMGKSNTFQSFMFVSQFLENKTLQQSSAIALKDIALATKLEGDYVKQVISRVIDVISGNDAQYHKDFLKKKLAEISDQQGFISIFNGKDLTGWKGLVENPISRSKMKPAELAEKQKKADEVMRKGWFALNGEMIFEGHGDNICTDKKYGDFEMIVDWKLDPAGPEPDAGIYLRGTPQVQIWDIARVNVGAQMGSGGLYNNSKNEKNPLKVADNKLGDWNSFHIIMKGDRVTVFLNGEKVVDNVIMENYWDRSLPIPAFEQIELQAHGSKVYYRDIYVKELERPEPFKLSAQEEKEGYKILFDGTNMKGWVGNTKDYTTEDGNIVLYPGNGGGGNLYTEKEYKDFIYRFEFMLTPGANNGLGIRTPLEGDAAYVGMELQILDDDAPIYKDLAEYQYHGSVYGVIPAKRGYHKPIGEWNYEEVQIKGNKIKITLNGTVIVEGDIAEASKNGTLDKKEHPGLKNEKGHIGFLGHGSVVKFRNIRIKELK